MSIKYLIGIVVFGFLNCAWLGTRSSSGVTASPDVVAASTDVHNVGTSSLVWQNGYFSRLRFSEKSEAASNVASFGQVWVSTDNNLYFTNDSGTTTRLN